MSDPKQAHGPKLDYTVLQDCWFGSIFKEEGSEITMTEAEAQYYVPHILQLKPVAKATKPASSQAKTEAKK